MKIKTHTWKTWDNVMTQQTQLGLQQSSFFDLGGRGGEYLLFEEMKSRIGLTIYFSAF